MYAHKQVDERKRTYSQAYREQHHRKTVRAAGSKSRQVGRMITMAEAAAVHGAAREAFPLKVTGSYRN